MNKRTFLLFLLCTPRILTHSAVHSTPQNPPVTVSYTPSFIIISGHTPTNYGLVVKPRPPHHDVCHVLITSYHLKEGHAVTDADAWTHCGSTLLTNLYNPLAEHNPPITCYFKTHETYALAAQKIIINPDSTFALLDINLEEYLSVTARPLKKAAPSSSYAPLYLKPAWTKEEKRWFYIKLATLAGLVVCIGAFSSDLFKKADDFVTEFFTQRYLKRHSEEPWAKFVNEKHLNIITSSK